MLVIWIVTFSFVCNFIYIILIQKTRTTSDFMLMTTLSMLPKMHEISSLATNNFMSAWTPLPHP